MPILKKPPEPHEHLDGDFGLDDLMALRAHLKGMGHGKNVFPGDSWKILTRKHMKAHGLTPVDGAPASAESLNEQIEADAKPFVTGEGQQLIWAEPKVTAEQAKAVWDGLYAKGGVIPSAGEFEAEVCAPSHPKGVHEVKPSWDFSNGHWVHHQPAQDGWATYHHWPALPPHECPEPKPEWDISVWVTHSDITNLESGALAKAAAATKKSQWLKVIKGYHVTTLPPYGSIQAASAAEQVAKAVEAGHTIAAHITVGWFPPAPGEKKPAPHPHPDCAFADHEDYQVVKGELVKAAKILGIASPEALALAKLAASIAVQVKAMDSQLDDVLAELGIKPPPGTPAVSGVNAGKLIPSSLAPAPPEDGKGLSTGLNWTAAHALLKFAGGLEHDEATDALGFAALNKDGFHKDGIHVTSPDPNSYAIWFDPEPGDEAPEMSAVVVWKAKGKPEFMPDQGKYHYPPSEMLMGDVAPETAAHLNGGECRNEHQAGQALTTGPGFWSSGQATDILAAAKKHQGHPLHVPAGNPQVTVLYNATMGKYCMKWHQAGGANPAWQPAGPGLKEHQAIDALVKSGWYDQNEALIVVLQAKNISTHEVKAPFVKVTFSAVTGLYTVEVTGAPKKKPALVTGTQDQEKMDAAQDALAKEKALKQLAVHPSPPAFDDLLGELAGPSVKAGPAWNDELTWTEAMFVLKNDSKGQFSRADAKDILAAAKDKDGGLVVTPVVQVMWCKAGGHYHVGWPQAVPAAKPGKAGNLHGTNTLNYSEALIRLKDVFGMSDSGASELLKNAQDEPGKQLTWKGPKGTVKVKWHLTGGHFHIWGGGW